MIFNKIAKVLLSSSSLMICLLYAQFVNADIYKCTNAHDKVVYNDKPCKNKQREKKMRSLKDPKSTKRIESNKSAIEKDKDNRNKTDKEPQFVPVKSDSENISGADEKNYSKKWEEQVVEYNARTRLQISNNKAKKEEEKKEIEAFESQLE